MMRLAPLLFVEFTLYITIHGQCVPSFSNDSTAFCCNPQRGPKIVLPSINLINIINESPNYGLVSTQDPDLLDLDNVCYTYYNIDGSSFVQFNGLRHSDGSCRIEKYIVAALTGCSGVSRVQGLTQDGGSTIVYDEVYLGTACPGVRVYYKNYVAARCNALMNFTSRPEFIHGDSSSREISDHCIGQVAAVANSQQLRDIRLIRLPNLLNSCCVTQFNGASCVNADRVLPQDSVSVPDSGTSSQTCQNV